MVYFQLNDCLGGTFPTVVNACIRDCQLQGRLPQKQHAAALALLRGSASSVPTKSVVSLYLSCLSVSCVVLKRTLALLMHFVTDAN